jgi:transcriptional regulator with XRE-family HTH domain
MNTEATLTIIWFQKAPYVVDIPACRRSLVRRQVEGELTNVASLAAAARTSRSTVSRLFSGRSMALASTLRILAALRLEFGDVCQPATNEEVAAWRRQQEERRELDERRRRERAGKTFSVR